jgi:hypothetical protein
VCCQNADNRVPPCSISASTSTWAGVSPSSISLRGSSRAQSQC